MTNESGTYALALRAEAKQDIEVGALGVMTVRPGAYVYVGSAFGPGGVQARVERHARGDGSTHWHVDYLRTVTTLETVWYTLDDTRRECFWARVLCEMSGAHVPRKGFGASDCNCLSHLVRFEDPPSLETVRRRIQERDPEHAPIRKVEGNTVVA